GLNLSIPLFDGNMTGAKVKQAQADIKAAEYYANSIEKGLELELKQLQLSLREIKEKTAAQKDAVSQATEYHKIALIGFKAGTMTNLEVVDAELALLNSKIAFLQALYEREITESAIIRCIGAGTFKLHK
ncbi:MAG: TolC family protein, partial [Candidatus Firestonebacteria bacterium]